MNQTTDSSIRKNSILLSRNRPVALVVGAAGFLGSHLVDKLLEKDIQVIGVDNLETGSPREAGKKENLGIAVENKDFHLIIESGQRMDLDLDRLDYLFILTESPWDLNQILELFKKFKCRCLFVSSIDLYGKESRKDLNWFKDSESKIAKFATDFNLNARILRLGPVYGPRMHFRTKDPLIRLIRQTLTNDLQQDITLEFSSRALYVLDAVDLVLRTMFAGSTAQKIFDGVLPVPIKVAEIKLVLLDPVWYENKGFTPSELPPWTTPNLEKTIETLNWQPGCKLVASLRKTLSYFKDNEIEVPELEVGSEKLEVGKEEIQLDEQKKEELELFRRGSEGKGGRGKGKGIKWPKFSLPLPKIYLFGVLSLITYALIWPGLLLGWGIYTFQNQLNEGLKNFANGEVEKSLGNINRANAGIAEVKSVYDSLEPFKKTGLLKSQFDQADKFIEWSMLSIDLIKTAAIGEQYLLKSLKAVTGEKEQSPADYFANAQIEIALAQQNLSKAEILARSSAVLSPDLIKRLSLVSILLPNLTAQDGVKSYLVLLQNNLELQPAGGIVMSFAKISFERGKLKKFEVKDVDSLEGKLNIYEEPDFPFNARQAQWFYSKVTGEKVDGVIAMDATALGKLLAVPVSAETNNLTDLANQLFNKLFFLPQNNWLEIGADIGSLLDEKHLSIYLNDPKLFSYLDSEGWAHNLPRQSEQNSNQDFLSLIEANLGDNKVNR
ncbi:NAD-dependent epimerase/dehydratase family protein [Candidatus Daviesbacteria bacterium]|nr:NAD-dependent epimerase/dehydratase family protein [Candidatus Daviesbacteria bacterium]